MNESVAIETIEKCITKARTWIINHKLQINDAKTEAIIFGTPQQLRKLTTNYITVGDDEKKIVDCVRNLGTVG